MHTARVPAQQNHSHHNQCRTPYAAVHNLAHLMMGIMMPETSWDKCLIINIRLVESCWFLSLHTIVSVLQPRNSLYRMRQQNTTVLSLMLRWNGLNIANKIFRNISSDMPFNEWNLFFKFFKFGTRRFDRYFLFSKLTGHVRRWRYSEHKCNWSTAMLVASCVPTCSCG